MARQSRSLNALVHGNFRENAERTVTWRHVDRATFQRFAQYVYCGDYDYDYDSGSNHGGCRIVLEDQKGGYGWIWAAAFKKSKRFYESIPNVAWRDFQRRQYEYSAASLLMVKTNGASTEDYSEVFLSHARLHVLADYHGVEPLMQMTLHKLHQILCVFHLHSERKGDVLKLLKFCFPESNEDEDQKEGCVGCPEELKKLVIAYIACHMKDLWGDEFQAVYPRYPELVLVLTTSLVEQSSN